MEIQMTDFENAAFSIFIVLITRAILSFDLNFYIPITKVTENMDIAHVRDAVLTQKFYFRKNPFPSRLVRAFGSGASGTSTPGQGCSRPPSPFGPVEDEYELMSIDEIINGQQKVGDETGFPGLIPLVENYLNSMNVDVETRCELARYLKLIQKRASGKLWTGARWIRNFVREHTEYKKDSVVGDGICYDLIKAVEEITKGKYWDEGLAKQMLGQKAVRLSE
jgi:glutamate--cysteine ligase catalytic subunit